MKHYLLITVTALSLLGCGSLAKDYDSTISDSSTSGTRITSNSDYDEDFIPNTIEEYLGKDPYNSDENGNGLLDGLETEGSFGDKFFAKQWYIYSTGSLTNGSGIKTIANYNLNLLPVYEKYMGYNGGNNIIIQIVDNGVYYIHEDLKDNIDLSRSHDGVKFGRILLPSSSLSHGTKVAGVIGARAFNGKGVRGIIPFAKIAVSNWLLYSSFEILEKVWYSGYGANDIALSNNSWGFEFSNESIPEEYMQKASSSLRNGKGRIFVFPAGNNRN
ncbi:MAG: S8 family serine peptidase, partial [Campylobacterales bacterium]|nr:S8 family serine peptidase [Campylobacterales bacterium]